MTRMDRVLGLVQAGGQGARLDVLTRERAKPALPFGGEYQLIDFAMTALARSGVPDVWVSVQYLAGSLDHHLAGGRPWDLDRTRHGYRRVVPEEGAAAGEGGFSTGNADDLSRSWRAVQELDPELVFVLSADHVFALDLRDVVDRHREQGAECTVVTAEVSRQEASNKAVVHTRGGWVTDIAYKPGQPESGRVMTEITLYDARLLGQALSELRRERVAAELDGAEESDASDSGLGDFGEHLLPWFVARGKVLDFEMPGYWRDVGRPESYLGAHRDLIAGRIDAFADPDNPILTRRDQRSPARFVDGCTVSDSIVSVGCVVRGHVERSVLCPGVVIEAGARVVDSVVFAESTIGAGAEVTTSVIDEWCVVGRNAVVGGAPAGTRPRPDDLTLVGRQTHIAGNAAIPAGARLEPGTRV